MDGLAFVGGLDLIYIHKPYPLSHTGLLSLSPQKPQPYTPAHGKKLFFSRATVSLEMLVSKGHNSRKGDNSVKKKKRVSYFSMRNPYMKFQNPSVHGS